MIADTEREDDAGDVTAGRYLVTWGDCALYERFLREREEEES
jgi:hypothetical protein